MAAALGGRLWDHFGRPVRVGMGLGAALFCGSAFYGATESARISIWSVHWEVKLIETMEACEGCVYVVGGTNGSEAASESEQEEGSLPSSCSGDLASAERYDPVTNAWSPLPCMLAPFASDWCASAAVEM